MGFVWSSGAKRIFRPRHLPRAAGPQTWRCHVDARRWVRSRARRRIRAVHAHLRGPPRGEIPGRIRGEWLHRSPPRPSTPLAPGPRGPYDRARVITKPCTRATLLTLTPTLPSRPDPCGPTCRSDFLSWGCPKIAPPSCRVEESDARESRLRASLRGWAASPPRVPPAWFLTTSTVSPPRPCRGVAPCCRSWGSPCFPSSRNEAPHSAVPALRSFPSADSDESGSSPSSWARVTGSIIADLPLHREPCPLVLLLRAVRRRSLVADHRSFPWCRSEPRPRGLAPSSGPLHPPPFPAMNARCSPGLVQSHRPFRPERRACP